MFGSVRSVATSALASLKYIAAQRAPGVSVRRWVRPTASPHEPSRNVSTCTPAARQTDPTHDEPDDPRSGDLRASPPLRALFIPYKAGEIAALKSVIATWLCLAIFEAMNGPEGDLKLRFIVDELDALGAIDGLKDALARLRKFGGRCVLGFQSIAQVSSLYGRGDAKTIVENCANTLILPCSASEGGDTAAFASHLIGEREILRAHTSESESRDAGLLSPRRHSRTQSVQHVTELAVLPGELEQLPDLMGYLKLASHPHWLRVGIQRR